MTTVPGLLPPLTLCLSRFIGRIFDRSYMTRPSYHRAFASSRRYVAALWQEKDLGFNRTAPWPMASSTTVSRYERLHFEPAHLENLSSPGCYFQNFSADIHIGLGTCIASKVAMTSANHSRGSLNEQKKAKPIRVGPDCWIGTKSVLPPGVTLCPKTIVGTESVVTFSHPKRNVTIVGLPAPAVRSA